MSNGPLVSYALSSSQSDPIPSGGSLLHHSDAPPHTFGSGSISRSTPSYPTDPLLVETTLQDYSQVRIQPDLVAAPISQHHLYSTYQPLGTMYRHESVLPQPTPPTYQSMSPGMSTMHGYPVPPPSVHYAYQGLTPPLPLAPHMSSSNSELIPMQSVETSHSQSPSPALTYASNMTGPLTRASPMLSPVANGYSNPPIQVSSPSQSTNQRPTGFESMPPPSVGGAVRTNDQAEVPPPAEISRGRSGPKYTQSASLNTRTRLSALAPGRSSSCSSSPIVTVTEPSTRISPVGNTPDGASTSGTIPAHAQPAYSLTFVPQDSNAQSSFEHETPPTGATSGHKRKRDRSQGSLLSTSGLSTTPSVEAAPLREEKKPTIACHHCRSKKLKCDGGRPKCSTCLKKGEEMCEYDAVLRRRGPGKNNKKDKAEKGKQLDGLSRVAMYDGVGLQYQADWGSGQGRWEEFDYRSEGSGRFETSTSRAEWME